MVSEGKIGENKYFIAGDFISASIFIYALWLQV